MGQALDTKTSFLLYLQVILGYKIRRSSEKKPLRISINF